MRRLLRFAGWTVLTLVAIVLAGLIVLQTSWAREKLLAIALDRANRVLHARLSIGRLGGSLFYGAVLDDVTLSVDGVPLFEAARVEVRYDPLMLARRQLVLADVTFQGSRIHLIQTEDGWNVESILKPQVRPGGPPTRFVISHLGTTDAQVTVTPQRAAPRMLRNVSFDARVSREDQGVSLELARFSAHDEPSGFDIRSLAGTFARSFDDIDATFDLQRGPARAAGRLEGKRQQATRRLRGVVDLMAFDLAPLLGDQVTSIITGRADVQAVLTEGAPASLTFSFAGPHAAAMGYEGQDLDLTGTLSNGTLAFAGTARAYDAALSIDARWRFAVVSNRQPWQFSGHGTYRHLRLTALPASLRLPPFETNLAGRYTLAVGPGRSTAETVLEQSQFEGAVLAKGTRGRVSWSRGPIGYSASGTITGLNLGRLAGPLELPLLAEPRFAGTINGPFEAEGSGTRPRDRVLRATATLTDSEFGGTRTTRLQVGTTLAGSRLEITAAGDFAGVTQATTGWASSPAMDLNGTADVRVALPDFHGPFSIDSIDVSGQVVLGPSTFREQPITAAVIDGDLVGGLATIRSLTIEAIDTRVSAAGIVALGPEGDSALTLTASSDDLTRVGALAGLPLAGAADLEAAITGPSNRPIARGKLNGRQLAYGTKASALTLDTVFAMELPDRDLTRAKGDGTVSAAFVKFSGFDVVRMETKANLDGRELTLDTRLEETARTVEIGGVIGFQPETRTVTLRHAQITAGQTTWALAQGQEARLSIGPDRIRVDRLTLVRDTQQIDISGGLALQPLAQAGEELAIQARGVRIEDINSLLLGRRAFGGVADGNITVRGSAKAPEAVADVTITDPRVDQVHFEHARAHVAYDNAVAIVDAELVQTAANRLTVKGSVPLSGPGLDLRVTSTPVDLAIAQAFTSEVSAIGGTGTFDFHVSGARNAPVVNGDVVLENGSFTVDASGVRYQGLAAQLAFKAGHLDVREFRVLDDAGHALVAQGGLDVLANDGLRSMNMRIGADGFRILNNKFGRTEIDADLRADGDLRAPKIEGRVRLAGGRIEVDQVLETTTKRVYATQPLVPDDPALTAESPGEGAPSRDTLFGRMDLNVRLDLPDDLVLRGRDLRTGGSLVSLGDMNLVAGGTLDLQKRPGGPLTAVGNLELVRGFYSFQGRRFDVERDSTVRFQGATPIDPALNVTATRTISGVDASVHVGGTMRDPTIDLSSRPALDDADVLSLIVFGQSVNDLGTGERTALGERAASMAAGMVAAPVADSIARALNLDMVEIQAPTDSSAPVVALGSQVGTRLYIGVRQEVGRGDSSLVSVEYRIASALRLVTSIALGVADRHLDNHKERSGVDLIYMVRY